MPIPRRDFLAAALAAPLASRAQAADRPNILFAISDDQSFCHTSAAGDPVVRTPHFDRVASEGVRFSHAFCSSPSCTPSRGTVLTGQECYRLGPAANLWSFLPADIPVYTDLLEGSGYHVGFSRKGWGPGSDAALGRTRNPAGDRYDDFPAFQASVPKGKPWCFWFGSQDPHRPYQLGSGLRAGLRIDDVVVPQFLPDSVEVRSDILDYFFEIERFDREFGEILDAVERAGQTENTLVAVTSDNGMPFPRAKANLYDHAARLPLAMRWPARVPGGRVVEDFVGFSDFAPTFLEAAGLEPRPEMTGRSLMPLLTATVSGRIDPTRDHVILARERHTVRREGRLGYPMRGIRTHDALYVRNLFPERWPAADPPAYSDIDGGPAKDSMPANAERPDIRRLFDLAFGKRGPEELYDLAYATDQMDNVAAKPDYASRRRTLAERLDRRLRETADPRALGRGEAMDTGPYFGRTPA